MPSDPERRTLLIAPKAHATLTAQIEAGTTTPAIVELFETHRVLPHTDEVLGMLEREHEESGQDVVDPMWELREQLDKIVMLYEPVDAPITEWTEPPKLNRKQTTGEGSEGEAMRIQALTAMAMMMSGGVADDFPMSTPKKPKTCPECDDKGHSKYCKGTAGNRHKMRRRV